MLIKAFTKHILTAVQLHMRERVEQESEKETVENIDSFLLFVTVV